MFDPKSKIKSIQGKDYLEVKWRIVWFREDHPKGGIITELESADPALIKASVLDEEGHVLGTGYGSPKTQGVSKFRPFEGAETAAIGRALAHAGYGTQFTGEDEDEHLADSPVERGNGQKKVELPKDDRMWTVAQKNALIDEKLAKNDFAARGMLGLSMLPVDATNQEIIEWGKVYRHYRIEEKMKAADAADKANAELLGVGA